MAVWRSFRATPETWTWSKETGMVPTLYWVNTCRRRRVNSSSSMGSSPTISTNWSSTPQRISHSWAVSSASWRRPAWAWAFIWVSRASWRRSSSMKS